MVIAAREKLNNYIWNGSSQKGIKESGEIEAASVRVARMLLRQKGIRIQKIKKESQPLFSGKKVKKKDIVIITRQLATLIEGGIPLSQAITAVGQSSDNPATRKLLFKLRYRVDSGDDLTTTLRYHPNHFNTLYTALVSVGEESGNLGPMMKRIATYLEKAEALRRKVKSALTYPVMVLVAGLLIAAGLLIFIIPKFQEVFSDFGADLPWLTRKVIGASEAAQQHWALILIVSVGFVFIYKAFYKRSASVKLNTDRMILRLPVFGDLIRKSILARISRTISIMFRAGIPMVEALGTIAPAAGNQVYTNALMKIRSDVSTGQPLESSMRDTKVFPSMVLQMVRTGEETGEMDAMLDKAADFYEDEVDNTVDAISSLVEPMLIIILGVVIGTVVIAMYLPIFKLASVV